MDQYAKARQQTVPPLTGPAVVNMILPDIIRHDAMLEDARIEFLLEVYPELKRREQEAALETEEDESFDEDETQDETQTDPIETVAPKAPAPRCNLLSRKRARSPSRELTPCPGPNREPFSHIAKRARIDLPEPSSDAETSMSERDARLQAAIERFKIKVKIANGELGLDGYPPDFKKAVADIRTRFAGKVTELHISQLTRKFLEHPKLPHAWMAWPDHKKEELFWILQQDQAQVDMMRAREKAHLKPQWESVLQTKHIKEIDQRPRGSNHDRVRLWLSSVTAPC